MSYDDQYGPGADDADAQTSFIEDLADEVFGIAGYPVDENENDRDMEIIELAFNAGIRFSQWEEECKRSSGEAPEISTHYMVYGRGEND